MLYFSLFMLVVIIPSSKLDLWPIRHMQIDISDGYNYIVNHPAHQIGLGVNSPNLHSCIYTCMNHDFCRTAVFQSQSLTCFLFEECSTFGQIVSDVQATLISFQVCNNGPEDATFSPPVIAAIPLTTVMSSLLWLKNLSPSPYCWFPFFVNDQIYVPLQNTINIHDTDTYQLVRSMSVPGANMIKYMRGDSQGTFVYSQSNDFHFYIYSLPANIVTKVNSSFSSFFMCYSKSFIVIVPMAISIADVYLRTPVNNSAAFIYRINGWSTLRHCVIAADQKLIGAIQGGGLQTTMLGSTIYNSTIVTLTMNTNYTPTSAALNMDGAGRLYSAPVAAYQLSTVYLPDGRLTGIHGGTRDSVGKFSKYKFTYLSSNGSEVSMFEYKPTP